MSKEKLRVEFLEEVRSQGEVYAAEDRRTFTDPDRIARAIGWIEAGVAQDLDGDIQTGNRKVVRPAVDLDVV